MGTFEFDSVAVAPDFSSRPSFELLYLSYTVIRHGQRLIESEKLYRDVLCAEPYERLRQGAHESSSFLRLQQLVTLGYIASLVAYWGDPNAPPCSNDFVSIMGKILSYTEAAETGAPGSPSDLTASHRQSAKRLLRFSKAVRSSKHYVFLLSTIRQNNLLDVPGALSRSDHDRLRRSIDRLALCARSAHDALIRDMFLDQATLPASEDREVTTNAPRSASDRFSLSEA